MDNLFWVGYSNMERHAAIDEIKKLVSKYGDIVDVHLFSDISLNMTIEIEECNVDKLYDELTPIVGLQKVDYLNSMSTRERTVYFNITFAKGTGNLKVEVPSVPG